MFISTTPRSAEQDANGKTGWLYQRTPPDPHDAWPPSLKEAGEGPNDQGSEQRRDAGWLSLAIAHTPFHATEQVAYRWIADNYRALESMFLHQEELREYYLECHQLERWSTPEGKRSAEGAAFSWRIRHAVALQMRFMEDVFYALRLDRYANAQDNRGWMNLFRRWGRSRTFYEHFHQMHDTFTAMFVEFCELYVLGCGSIEAQPVPHPWDPRERRTRTVETVPRRAVKPGMPVLFDMIVMPGVYLDSGLYEAEVARIPSPAVSTGGHGASGAKKDEPPSQEHRQEPGQEHGQGLGEDTTLNT